MTKDLTNKTVSELRTLAKLQGVKGYSAMRKAELVAALSGTGKREKTTRAGTAVSARALKSPPKKAVQRQVRARERTPVDEEQHIAEAKYVTTASGRVTASAASIPIGDEATEKLPELRAPMLAAMLQKPGVLHVYWVVEPVTLREHADLKLRVSHVAPECNQVLHEVAVTAERDHWYLQIDPGLASGRILVQLGYYRDDGTFLTLLRHAIERLPRLAASVRTDPAWAVSDEQFRKMYEQAGGTLEHGHLAWSATAPHLSSK